MCYEYNGSSFCEQCADKEIRRLEKMGVPESANSKEWPKRVGYGENAKKCPVFCVYCGEYLPYKLTPQGVEKAVDKLAGMVQFRTEADGSFVIADYRDTARWIGDEPYPLHIANALLNQRLGPGQAFLVRAVRGKMLAAMRRRSEAADIDGPEVLREAAERLERWHVFGGPVAETNRPFLVDENHPIPTMATPRTPEMRRGLDRLVRHIPAPMPGWIDDGTTECPEE